MKHKPIAINEVDLYNRITESNQDASMIMEIFEIEDLDYNPRPDIYYVVIWPDHVTVPEYNGDPAYHGPMTRQEALVYRDNVVEYSSR